MAYFQALVTPVPGGKRAEYLAVVGESAAMFREYGATRVVECWGNEVPEGKTTDFRRAVLAEPGEVIVLTVLEFPSKDVAMQAYGKVMADPRMKALGPRMPFDGKRMIYGGFDVVQDV